MSNLPCHDVRLELVAYLDGELAKPIRDRVEEHLAGCHDCQAERLALDGVWEALDHLPGLEARPGWLAQLETEVLAAAEAAAPVAPKHAPAASQAPSTKLPWALAAAAGLLMAGGVAWWAQDGSEVHQPQVAPATRAPRVSSPDAPETRVPKQELLPDVEVPTNDGRYDVPTSTPTQTPAETEAAIAAREKRRLEQEFAKLDPIEREVVENLEALALLEEREDRDLIQNLDLLDDLDEDELDEG